MILGKQGLWDLKWIWIGDLKGSFNKISSTSSVVKKTNIAIFVILSLVIWKWIHDIIPLWVDYYSVEESEWNKSIKLIQEKVSEIMTMESEQERIKEEMINILYSRLSNILILIIICFSLYYSKKNNLKIEKAKEEALSLNKNIETLLETTAQGFFVLSSDWIIMTINQSLSVLLWYDSEDEIIWKNIINFVHDDDKEKFKECYNWNIVCELYLVTKTWVQIQVQIRWSIMKGDDGELTLCAFVTDLTQIMDFINANIKSIKAREDFLRNVTHELRTPLNSIIWFLNLLLNTELNEDQRKYLETMGISSKSLLRLINDILDFSKIKEWQMTIEQIPVNIWKILDNIKKMLTLKINEKNLYLNLNIQKDVQKFIWDPFRLEQILINLIWNAIKFTEKWGIIVNCFLEISWENWDKNIILEIIDSGIWMSKEDFKGVFGEFVQVNGSTTRKYWWTGLWLAICKRLVELMKWKISVQSELWKWSIFTVSIPYIITDNYDVNDDWLELKQEEGGTFNTGRKINKKMENINILIVDDEEVNLSVNKCLLTNLWFEDWNITTCENWREAIDLIEKWQKYDLIITDENMPVINWSEMAGIIRTSDNEIVIISLSGNYSDKHITTLKKSWMDAYLIKSYNTTKLWHFLGQFFENSEDSD